MRAAVRSVISVSSLISGYLAVFEILGHASGHTANKTSWPRMRQLVLPVHFRVLFKILLFVFKYLNALASVQCFRSADQLLLGVPRSKQKLREDRIFSVAASTLWNDLPLLIRQVASLSIFKTHLKTHFYSLAVSGSMILALCTLIVLLLLLFYCFMFLFFFKCTALCVDIG